MFIETKGKGGQYDESHSDDDDDVCIMITVLKHVQRAGVITLFTVYCTLYKLVQSRKGEFLPGPLALSPYKKKENNTLS